MIDHVRPRGPCLCCFLRFIRIPQTNYRSSAASRLGSIVSPSRLRWPVRFNDIIIIIIHRSRAAIPSAYANPSRLGSRRQRGGRRCWVLACFVPSRSITAHFIAIHVNGLRDFQPLTDILFGPVFCLASDIVKSNVQLADSPPTRGYILRELQGIVTRDGWKGLFRGLSPTRTYRKSSSNQS